MSDIVNEEIDKVGRPDLSNKKKFEIVSGKAVARFREEFPNVDILRFTEEDGEILITLSVNDLH